MPRYLLLLLLCLCLAGLSNRRLANCGVAQTPVLAAPDTLVLCPEEFQTSLSRWLDWRRDQGYRIQVMSPAPIAAGIKTQIQKVAALGKLKNVLLIGDSGDIRAGDRDLLATDFIRAKVNVRFGSEPEIATDNTFADLNGDGLPDLTIGRIPVDTVDQLTHFVDRVIEYESRPNHSLAETLWRRRINFVAGVGGFGRVIDSVVEQTTKQIITDLVPPNYRTSMTYGSWSSPYCPDPRRFSEVSIRRFNEGCMFWVYVGHGARQRLDRIQLPDQSHPILDNFRARMLNCEQGSPIAIFLACYTGATDGHHDGLAETMLLQPRGPIAVLCGTRVTMPYAMGLLSLEMMDECFTGDAPTLGELTRVAKRRMVQGDPASSRYRQMIEGMGSSLSPLPELLEAERLEHVQLVHLIGDPLLKIKRPDHLEIQAVSKTESGSELKLRGTSPVAGEMLIELAYVRDRFRKRPKRRREYIASDAAFRGYQATYEQSQQLVCERVLLPVQPGAFEEMIQVPDDAFGRCHVRAVIVSPQTFAMGATPVRVVKPQPVREARIR